MLFVARESARVGARGPHSMSLSATPPPMDPQSMSAESGLLGPLLSLEELSRLRRKLGLDKCVPKKTLKQCVPTAPLYPHTPEYESELHDVVCIGEKRGLRNVSPLCETRSQSSDNSLAYSLLLWLKVLHATVGLPQCATMEHNMRDASEKRWKWRGSAAWAHAPRGRGGQAPASVFGAPDGAWVSH